MTTMQDEYLTVLDSVRPRLAALVEDETKFRGRIDDLIRALGEKNKNLLALMGREEQAGTDKAGALAEGDMTNAAKADQSRLVTGQEIIKARTDIADHEKAMEISSSNLVRTQRERVSLAQAADRLSFMSEDGLRLNAWARQGLSLLAEVRDRGRSVGFGRGRHHAAPVCDRGVTRGYP